jgi:hypothetical protein
MKPPLISIYNKQGCELGVTFSIKNKYEKDEKVF